MSVDCDVVVVGAGLAGAAAAWELTGRGHSVVLLEAHELHHRLGSSHGTSRIFRRAYADPFYVGLTGRATSAWDRLESESGVALRVRTGGIDSGGSRDLPQMATTLRRHGVRADLLDPKEVAQRWPGMQFSDPVLFHPDAGHFDPEATISACVALAVAAGATLVEHTPVVTVHQNATGVTVDTAGRSYTARQVVMAPGAWLPELMEHIGPTRPVLPALTVTQQEVFHFRRVDPDASWPTLVHKDSVQLYGLPSGADGGPEPAMKVARFDHRTITTAGTRDGLVDPAARTVVTRFVGEHLPGLEPDPVEEQSCLFTMTPDENFILDRMGSVVIASACSGHGAKFAPLLGTLIADLVEGGPAEPRFTFRV